MAKEQKKTKKPVKIHTLYEKTGEGMKPKNKACPKCGAGVFMANHKNRWSCGKCSYTEYKKKD